MSDYVELRAQSVWRVGGKIPLNVYDGDRPVCQCHSVEDASRIVTAMNGATALLRERDELKARVQDRTDTELAAYSAGLEHGRKEAVKRCLEIIGEEMAADWAADKIRAEFADEQAGTVGEGL